MILAPLALVLLATTSPETVTLPQQQSLATAVVAIRHVSLRDAAIDAALRSGPRLEQMPPLRGGPSRLRGVRPGRKALAIGLGVLAGFVGSFSIAYAASDGECPPPLSLVASMTAGGGAVGWLLTR